MTPVSPAAAADEPLPDKPVPDELEHAATRVAAAITAIGTAARRLRRRRSRNFIGDSPRIALGPNAGRPNRRLGAASWDGGHCRTSGRQLPSSHTQPAGSDVARVTDQLPYENVA